MPPARPTALVTGGSAGIGAAFARALAARGHDLVLVARDGDRLASAAADLRARHGVEVEVLVADLADREALGRVAARVADRDRPVDLLVNNAGFGVREGFVGGDLGEQERMLDVLCRAVLVLSHAGATAMSERGRGALVTVSSVAGWSAMGPYAAAKAWATTFTEALAAELRGTGVTATALCPGFVRTEFHQRARMAMGWMPRAGWLDADELVAACLDDVRRGKVLSVPSRRYRLAVALLRHAPRALVRRGSSRVRTRRA
jgi:uncharacterized protein